MRLRYGLPRTMAAAKRRLYKPINVDFSEMKPEEMAAWVPIDIDGARLGSLSHIHYTLSMGDRPGVTKVCYHDSQGPICFQVPDEEAKKLVTGS